MQGGALGEFARVMAGLDPAIHGAEGVCRASQRDRTGLLKNDPSWRRGGSPGKAAGNRVDGRVKPGHDGTREDPGL